MKFQRKYFFDKVRASLFSGSLSEEQVDGMEKILSYAESIGCDDRHTAYILSTAYHETARTLQPIEEYGKGKGHSYGEVDPKTGQAYYGRGYVQLTWKENYQKQDDKLKLHGELVRNANLALDPDIALRILFGGMYDGDFTGAGLPKYITCTDPQVDETDFFNARKIVNGLDCAAQIEEYAYHFAHALMHAESRPAAA